VDTPGPMSPTPLAIELAGRIAAGGPLRFDAFMDAVLYDPTGGFYASGGRAGARAGDFLTSPEAGPLFGAVLAGAVDQWWDHAGQPSVFTVVEVGAGPGTLAAAVRLASPRCAPALRWVMVERTDAQRAGHVERLGAATTLDAGDDARVELVSLADIPDNVAIHVVVANELLDNLPVRVLQRTSGGWAEVWVSVTTGAGGPELVESLVGLEDAGWHQAVLDHVTDAVGVGQRIALQEQAMDWLRRTLPLVEPMGRVVVIDYADTTASMAARGQESWMRTYAAHGRGAGPLDACGSQDLTCDVAVDQLAQVRPPDIERTQAEFLAAYGIEDLVAEGRREWTGRTGVADLAAVRALSRISEAGVLTALDGLGAHRVLEWDMQIQSATGP
jgi:SAM-dependent MidA family methyltransferase